MRNEPGIARRWALRLLWLSYPVLLLGAWLAHRAALSAFAGLVLISLLLWPALARRSRVAIGLWLAAVGVGVTLVRYDHADLVLLLLPVVINAALAGLFAQTLRVTEERPLIARVILALEGEARLASPGVAHYAHRLTLVWSLLLAGLSLLLLLAALFASPGGILDSAGQPMPYTLPHNAVVWAGQLGVYLVIVAFFAIEFMYRLWHFRHLPHPTFKQFIHKLARNWPRLLHDSSTHPASFPGRKDLP